MVQELSGLEELETFDWTRLLLSTLLPEPFSNAWVAPLKSKAVPYVYLDALGNAQSDLSPSATKLLLPGSFNPLHIGHIGMLNSATSFFQRQGVAFDVVSFELSVFNVDKPPLSDEAILDRAAQFAGKYGCIFTNAPTFIMKARLQPNTTFVLGYDTAIRLIMKKYYNDSHEEMEAAFDEFARLRCRFLVACRAATRDSPVLSLDQVEFPSGFKHRSLFLSLPVEQFRVDISSSAIRSGQVSASL